MNRINIFDNDDIKIKNQTFKYSFLVILILIIVVFLFLTIKKNRFYQNNIQFIDRQRAYIIVEKSILEVMKNINSLFLNNVSYNYSIEKIEEQEEIYLVIINFSIEIDVNTKIYQVLLEKESIMKYIIRIVKGE